MGTADLKNSKTIELCEKKELRGTNSNPRTHRANGVAERKNRTLIEPAKPCRLTLNYYHVLGLKAVSTACICNPAGSFQPAGSYEPAGKGNPAVSTYDQLSSGIFTSSSYDDDFSATLTNLAPAVEVNPVPTKRVNTIHPQSQILGDLASPVLTRSKAQKSKFGKSAFKYGYIQDQQRTIKTDQLHCLFACFLSQLEPTSIAKALEDSDWVAAMQEEMQQFINQKVWTLVPLPLRKMRLGTKGFENNEDAMRNSYVRIKQGLVAQGHRQTDHQHLEPGKAILSAFLLQHNYRSRTIGQDTVHQEQIQGIYFWYRFNGMTSFLGQPKILVVKICDVLMKENLK
ncbi:hypothetical protein Tco_0969794 [Tanacetum coccineum]